MEGPYGLRWKLKRSTIKALNVTREVSNATMEGPNATIEQWNKRAQLIHHSSYIKACIQVLILVLQ